MLSSVMVERIQLGVQFFTIHVIVRFKDYIFVVFRMWKIRKSVLEIWTYNLWTEQWKNHGVLEWKQIQMAQSLCGVAIGSDLYMYARRLGTVWKVTRNTDGSFEWSTIKFENSKLPSPRSDVCVWEYEEKLWTFGDNNQLLCYDPEIQSWLNVKCHGEVPTPRSLASAAAIKDKVWLFGRISGVNSVFNELYELSMHSVSWTQIKTRMPWPPRMTQLLSTPITGSKLVLHDGLEENFVWILDVQSYTWSQYKISFGHEQTSQGITGLSSDVIFISSNDIRTTDTDCHLFSARFSVMLEAKRLAQLAMKQIYQYRKKLPWKNLPPRLICKMELNEM